MKGVIRFMLQRDIQELEKAISDFYNVTNIMISLFDENFKIIASYPRKNSPFCDLIRRNGLSDKCNNCDKIGMTECKQQKKLFIYECHMGMVEAVAPIMSSDVITGYLMIGQVLPEHGLQHIHSNIDSLPHRLELTKESLYASLEQIKPLSMDKLKSAAHILEMCTCYISLNRIVSSLRDPLQSKIEEYILSNLENTELSMQSICNRFLISRSSLYELSKKFYGVGISDYIRHCRIEKAKKLLLDTDKSITEIGYACGFNDISYFSKVFMKHTGTVPKKYAAMVNNQKT